MKRLTFILLIFAATNIVAQNFPYETEWKEIKTAAEPGNVKSLLPIVDAIYKRVKIDGIACENKLIGMTAQKQRQVT